MQIDRTSPIPVYRQILEQFRGRILSGDLPAGYRLPPERKLAESLGVNRSTVVTAYRELAAAGLVEARPGSGTMVARHSGQNPNWMEYVTAGQFFPDSALRAEVLAIRRRPGMLSLAEGEPSPDCLPDLRPLLAEMPANLPLSYPAQEGYGPLREQIAALMRQGGEAVGPEDILVLGGAQQGFHLVSQCLLQPGDGAVAEACSYVHSLGIFPSAGVRVFSVPGGPEGLSLPDLSDLLARRNVRMLMVNLTTANPTGVTMPAQQRRELLALCAKHQLPVLEDDPYRGLWWGPGTAPPSLKALDPAGHVLYLGSFSKSLAPGLRVGWMAGPRPVLERLAAAKAQMDHGSSTLSQWLVAEWLRQGRHEEHLARLRLELRRRCEALEDALRAHLPMASWESPGGGFHLWCRFDLPLSSVELCRVAAAAGVAIMPGALYGRESAGGGARVRLSFCSQPPEVIREAVRRLAQAVAAAKT